MLAKGPEGDSLWAASSKDGEVRLIRIDKRKAARTERSFKVGKQIFALESAPDAVAVLQFEETARETYRWTLLVLDAQGQTRLRAEVPEVPIREEPKSVVDRFSRIVENRCVWLTSEGVAVGGPARLTVWSLRTGQILLDDQTG